jgi:superfamily II DNA or RNA helicase
MAAMRERAPDDFPVIRAWVKEGRHVGQAVETCVDAIAETRRDVQAAVEAVLADLASRRLMATPLAALRDATTGRVPLARLEQAGYSTVGQLLGRSERQLQAIPGVGVTTARAVVAARDALWTAALQETALQIRLDPADPHMTSLLRALDRFGAVRQVAAPWWETLWHVAERASRLLRETRHVTRLRWLFLGPAARQRLATAAAAFQGLADEAVTSGLLAVCDEVADLVGRDLGNPWARFEAGAGDYYALLGEFVSTTTPVEATRGYAADDVVAAVLAQDLDQRYLHVDLRGYQVFGAQFLLARHRAILGDEMGLGKTIQALAALSHVMATDPGLALIVCPASVLVNWSRELDRRTSLAHTVIHGPDRRDDIDRWLAAGGVGLTTYDTARGLDWPEELRLRVLIGDEAHYAKNPAAARSRALAGLAARARDVWLLTGTPMENHVDEFGVLARYVVGAADPGLTGLAGRPLGPTAFRRQVSGFYLRRNAVDVLVELPDRTDSDEWVAFTGADRAAYREAVRSGNLMAMRRAGYAAAGSAKLERFVELVEEAGATGRKVVAYSYFLDVVKRAAAVAPGRCFGPLTGAVSPAERQKVVDEFTAWPGPALLVAQIKVGGVGLNIQAASVVILMEPQLTPTAEEQAIARSYRMGQVRPVQVYRLLADRSVDETLSKLLGRKAADFDAYVRQSNLAQAATQAVDLSVDSLTRQLVTLEQARDLR